MSNDGEIVGTLSEQTEILRLINNSPRTELPNEDFGL